MSVRRTAEVALFPILVLALGAWAVAAPSLDLAAPLGAPPEARDALSTLASIAFFYPLIALLERALPHRTDWSRSQGDLAADTLHLLLSGPLADTLSRASVGAAALGLGARLSARLGGALWPTSWPLAAQLALAVWLAELGHYAFHRLSHEHPLVWRLHATHHSAVRLYWLNATRFQVLDLFCLVSLQLLPLVALGAGRDALLAYTVFAAVYGQIQHGNVALRTGPLDWIFSTPGLHRWHHSTHPEEGNRNYGAILVFWDLAFGSFFRPRNRVFAGPVGIPDPPAFPAGWWGQQLSPLRWSRLGAERGGTR
jgi:sterol desaturase/sphingolipid hydroxylase (fatty acid hydroxylase superfamily)